MRQLKIKKSKSLKTYFDDLSIRVSQSKTMLVETIYIFLLTKYRREDLSNIYLGGVSNKTIIPNPLPLVGYEMIDSQRSANNC